MASLADSVKADAEESLGRRRLNATTSTPRGSDPWSHGPVYRRLDSDFLERPLIPKAPPAPRMHIDRVDGSLRVVDTLQQPEVVRISPTPSLGELAQPHLLLPQHTDRRPILLFQMAAVVAGFLAGLAAAFLMGWL